MTLDIEQARAALKQVDDAFRNIDLGEKIKLPTELGDDQAVILSEDFLKFMRLFQDVKSQPGEYWLEIDVEQGIMTIHSGKAPEDACFPRGIDDVDTLFQQVAIVAGGVSVPSVVVYTPSGRAMTDLMRIRIEGQGNHGWQYRVVDADTGKVLPVTLLKLEVTPTHEPVYAEITIQIAEVSIETMAVRRDEVLRIEDYLAKADIETREITPPTPLVREH